jgi:hypothetical protein
MTTNTDNMVNNRLAKTINNSIAALVLTAASLGAINAHAYDLQANTIYAQAEHAIYAIDLEAGNAKKVADAVATLSELQDLAFDGSSMYGVNKHWQLMKLAPLDSAASSVRDAESFSLQFHGLEARDGVLYAAERNSMLVIDQATGNTDYLCDGCIGYGLGAGELVTDLAFTVDGTLYASVQFPGIPYAYLGTIDIATGQLNLVGNTGVENIVAITVKDAVIYAMDNVGDLYTLNDVSGFATDVATGVLPGVTGMATSPRTIEIPVVEEEGQITEQSATEEDGGAGSMTWLAMVLAGLVSLLRRSR